jgi:hypothetical protein
MLNTRQTCCAVSGTRPSPWNRCATAQNPSRCSAKRSRCFSTRRPIPPRSKIVVSPQRKKSKGWIRDGHIVCGYHGWEYDRDGKLMTIPQFPFEQATPDARAKSFHARARYGYVWVCLGEPLADIPELPYESDGEIEVPR